MDEKEKLSGISDETRENSAQEAEELLDNLAGISEEEKERLRRIEKLDANTGRKKIIFAGVTVFLIALFVFGTIFGGKYILSYEGSEPLPAEPFGELSEKPEELIALVRGLAEDSADADSVKLDRRFHVSIPSESVSVTGGPEKAEEMLGFIRESAESRIAEYYAAGNHDGAFGEDQTAILPVTDISASSLKEASWEADPENDASLTVRFVFEGCPIGEASSSPANPVFGLDGAEDRVKAAEALFASDLAVTKGEYTYGDLTVTAHITRSRKNGEEKMTLDRLEYTRLCDASLGLKFAGDLAAFGEQQTAFTAAVTEEYIFTRAGFTITNHEYFIEKGNSDEIGRRVVSDEGVQDIKITWSSSDPEILSVDEKGFYKGRRVSDSPVTVTGTYTYNGKTYTDECLFYVRVPAESVKLSEKELTMKAGEQKPLEAKVSPADATYSDVYYFSADESIAVFEDGVVRAVAPGGTTVYVITFDGNFKKSCSVTVTE